MESCVENKSEKAATNWCQVGNEIESPSNNILPNQIQTQTPNQIKTNSKRVILFCVTIMYRLDDDFKNKIEEWLPDCEIDYFTIRTYKSKQTQLSYNCMDYKNKEIFVGQFRKMNYKMDGVTVSNIL